MNVSPSAPKRPALRYYGSQWKNAPWILSHWPQHNERVIPFMGGLNEVLRAPAAKLETAADLDGRVINFFDVLRNQTAELVQAIKFTPWHEGEYKRALNEPVTGDPLEDARRFFMACWLSVKGGPSPRKGDFCYRVNTNGRWVSPSTAAFRDMAYLHDVADRLSGVQFLQRDGRRVIDKHKHLDCALTWCDPPFLKATRASTKGYAYDSTELLHIEIAELLHQVDGYALINGYAHPLYKKLYEDRGWVRVDKECPTNSGGKRVQSVWMNPKTVDALASEAAERKREAYPLLALGGVG